MIKIELEFPTGAEARRALLDLLQGNMAVVRGEELQNILDRSAIGDEKIAGNSEAPKTETAPEETPAKKRQTKAEKALEAAQPKIEETLTPKGDFITRPEGETNDGPFDVSKPAEETTSAVTAKMLQDKAVSVIRLGKKEEVTKLLEKFGAKSISQADKSPLKVEDYAAVMDELNKL